MLRDEETDTSSISDNDSEWTQIHSGDESDIVPSVSSWSQRDANSVDDDGDGWDGLMSTTFPPDAGFEGEDPMPLTKSDAANEDAVEAQSLSSKSSIADNIDANITLEMSMTGTLEANRSIRLSITNDATPLAHSLADSQSKLRLSFPDPLTRSSEDIISTDHESEVKVQLPDINSSFESSQKGDNSNDDIVWSFDSLTSTSHVAADPGATSTPAISVTSLGESIQSTPYIKPSFTIILYGANPIARWSTAERLFNRAFSIEQNPFDYEEVGHIRMYHLNSKNSSGMLDNEFCVRVIDMPHDADQPLIAECDEPSLALIFLPYSGCLFNHDLYLPLVSRPMSDSASLSDFPEKIIYDSAQYSLQQLDLPNNKLVTFGNSTILDEHDLDETYSKDVVHLFSSLLGFPLIHANTHLHTFVGEACMWITKYTNLIMPITVLLSVVLAFLVNINSEMTATVPANLTMITDFSTTSSHSIMSKASLVTPTTQTLIMVPSLKDKAIALVQPSTSIILSSARGLHHRTSLIKPKQTTDLITVPETSLLPTTSPVCRCDCKSTSWSEHSMSDITKAAGRGLKPLMDAVEELIISLRWSVDMIKGQWVDRAQIKDFKDRVTKELMYRNSRARSQAKRLRNYGKALALNAVDTIKSRALSLFEPSLSRRSDPRSRTPSKLFGSCDMKHIADHVEDFGVHRLRRLRKELKDCGFA